MAFLGFGNYITPQGLHNLKNYAYRPGKYTPLDNAMQPFWNWFVSLVPIWMAPNVLTLMALGFSLASCMVFLPFDATLTEPFPIWTYLFAAFCVFMYQTLDAVDGKQARRTQSSSPLGQLFDHGCDAINANFFGFMYYQCFQMGTTPAFFAMVMSSSVSPAYSFCR